MRAPGFWWREQSLAAILLQPLAAAYGAAAAWRLRRAGETVGVPVVCIGDVTLGGAGKTPTAIAVAQLLAAAGERPAVLSRGYGGRLAGPIQVDPARHTAAEVGDEPLLAARVVATVVARDRVAGVRAARAAGAGAIVMDDGFQNPALAKDCAIVVVDARRGIGNGRVFPAGPLRAPLARQLARAHALLVIGDGDGADALLEATREDIPRFAARLEPDAQRVAELRGRRLLAFAGIGHPDKFFATLAAAGLDAPVQRAFPDHHAYSQAEAAKLLAEAERNELLPVTTEKDFVRLAHGPGAIATLHARTATLPVRLRLEDEARLRALILKRIRARSA